MLSQSTATSVVDRMHFWLQFMTLCVSSALLVALVSCSPVKQAQTEVIKTQADPEITSDLTDLDTAETG